MTSRASFPKRLHILYSFLKSALNRESACAFIMRQVHLGARLPDSLALPQKTYELDTQTTVSAVSDLTKGLYNKDTLMQKAIEIQGASEIDVDFDKELKQLVQKGGLLKSEGREVEKLLMNNNPEDGVTGGATLWKLTQGITAFAREPVSYTHLDVYKRQPLPNWNASCMQPVSATFRNDWRKAMNTRRPGNWNRR